MAKPIGPICNLDCTYCFYLEKENLYPKNNFRMPENVLEKFIKSNIEANDIPTVTFSWQGGEPTLLGVEYFEKVIELQKKYSNGKKIENTFQTNGVLLDDKWCEYFKKNNFLIGLSIDGPREFHDKYRISKSGNNSFDQVVRGIKYLKKWEVEFNTLTVINDYNSHYPLKVYNFLKEIGSGFMQFIPVVELKTEITKDEKLSLVSPNYEGNACVTKWSVKPEKYGDFLIKIFDSWIKNDVGIYFVQLFDIALESWYGMEPSLCVFRKTCGDALALEHNGDLYSCDHYVYPENKLGNILEAHISTLVNSPKQAKFGLDKNISLPSYCYNCEVRFACNGECPKHRFIKTPDGEEGLNYLCAGYKKFFNHIDPFMKFMVNELINQRPPANVMKFAKSLSEDNC